MMLTRLTYAAACALTPAVGFAQSADDDVRALFAAMQLPELVEIMREEGIEYGDDIANDLFPNQTAADWPDAVAQIYDYDVMLDGLQMQFGAALGDADLTEAIAFFESDLGQQIVGLEVSARRALMDDDLETASKEAAAAAITQATPRFTLVEQYVAANDLVETNVVGAMNANYAFYTGLLEGGAFGQSLTEDQILSDVWSQEAEIRINTYEWVYSYLLMAYQPLSDGDLKTYITLSESDAGQALNDALFVAFDGMFEQVSHALGLAAAQYMTGQDL